MKKKKYLKVLNDVYSYQFNFKVKKLPYKNFSKYNFLNKYFDKYLGEF